MKIHQHFEFGPASQDPFSSCQIQVALDTVYTRPDIISFVVILIRAIEKCTYRVSSSLSILLIVHRCSLHIKRACKKTSKAFSWLVVMFPISSELFRNTYISRQDPVYFIPVAKGLDHNNIRESFLMKKGSHLGNGLQTLHHIKFIFCKAMYVTARTKTHSRALTS